MNDRIVSVIASIALLASLPASASAHTGGITNDQACDTGTVVTVTLDDNVAPTATWRVDVRGVTRDHGTGPGPATTSYGVGPAAGSATLYITFGDEQRHYSTVWPRLTGCTVPRVYHPAARISAPCADPMFRVTLDNRRSTGRVTFHVTWHDGGSVRTVDHTLRAGQLAHTRYVHGDGRTSVIVTARGRLLDRDVLPPGGWYGACR